MTTMTATIDLSFEDYTTRQYREIEFDQLLERATGVQPSGNYKYVDASVGWVPQPYPGYAVLSMVGEEPGNESLPPILKAVQRGLMERCPWEESIYLLPADSYHQTVANTLSGQRFMTRVLEPGLEGKYPGMVAKAFEHIGGGESGPVAMKLIGMSIFGTALGVLGVFEKEADYQRILQFRTGFYADPELAALDVRMTRPFIGHITLAYIETPLLVSQRQRLAVTLHELNGQLREVQPVFHLSGTGLRRYEHLSAFEKADGYLRYEF